MKTKTIMGSVLFTLIFLMGTIFSSSGQVSANANVTATIVTPITITKILDINFGNIAIGALAGTVTINPSSVRSLTGGITLPTITGTFNAAKFEITGENNYGYSITLPSTDTIVDDGAGHSMIVNNWTSSPTPVGLLSSGKQDLFIGATINVLANQPAGTYTSNIPFTITVNYN
jgi:hypothetical protein